MVNELILMMVTPSTSQRKASIRIGDTMTSLRWHYPDQVIRVLLSSIKNAPSQNKKSLY
ncbi:hypothetical protein XBJ1_2740 [Xenorhabdus bovienii SS-2004]|uniref:Uncharacterized protein n=1 Tax=Xenorhabdus bovienii (strain SS-2004) TaxID=406818 RepID=D3V7Q2_XENBS|nr:hypothetical protein XBJ1_2740 [Xenorhabdus bovienii SS-2004]